MPTLNRAQSPIQNFTQPEGVNNQTQPAASFMQRIQSISPSAPAPRLDVSNPYTQISEMSPRTDYMRAYQPLDFKVKVQARFKNYEDMIESSESQLHEPMQAVQEHETSRIAVQTVLFKMLVTNPKLNIDELNILALQNLKKIDFNSDEFRAFKAEITTDFNNIKKFVNHQDFKYNKETNRYTNKSGLSVAPAVSWNSMTKMKHKLMRVSPIYQYKDATEQVITGKIYADFLDRNNDAVSQVLNISRSEGDVTVSNSSDKEAIQREFHEQKNIFEYALKAILNEATQKNVRPSIVTWANDEESEQYITTVGFNEGKMQFELPEITFKQFDGDIPTGLTTDDGKAHVMVFVQDLEGNVKTTRHKDTHYHHSTPNGGRPVRTAGEAHGHFKVENEGESNQKVFFIVDKLCNQSGHYWPSIESFGQFRDDLIASGLDPSKIKFESANHGKNKVYKSVLESWSSLATIPFAALPDVSESHQSLITLRTGIEQALNSKS